jgi:hypothetical protein
MLISLSEAGYKTFNNFFIEYCLIFLLPVLPVKKDLRDGKNMLDLKFMWGIKNKKVTYNVTFAGIKDTFNKCQV